MPPKLYRPDGSEATTETPPSQQAVVMEREDGVKVAYPLVACAVISPEVLAAIGQAVAAAMKPARRSKHVRVLKDTSCSTESAEPLSR